MSKASLVATFNADRSSLLRMGTSDGWFDYCEEPDEKEIFLEHCFHEEGRRLWLNEHTQEFVVTNGDDEVVTPTLWEQEEAQYYWTFLLTL